MNTLILFFFGLLVVQTVCLIWFYSPFKTSLGQILINRDISMNDEFETWLLIKSPFFGKLLSCYICFSFWTSLLAGVTAVFLFSLPVFTPFITALTYPSICYLYKSFIDRSL